MAVVTPFRTTPNLGPALTSTSASNYWDTIRPDGADPTYQPGTRVTGSDGHEYIYVEAHADLAAAAVIGVSADSTASTASTGWTAPVAVVAGDYFHARKTAL